VLSGLRRRTQFLEVQPVPWWIREYQVAGDLQPGVDMDQLARVEELPPRVIVHPFSGEHHRRLESQLL
jgi:hypothetical protein